MWGTEASGMYGVDSSLRSYVRDESGLWVACCYGRNYVVEVCRVLCGVCREFCRVCREFGGVCREFCRVCREFCGVCREFCRVCREFCRVCREFCRARLSCRSARGDLGTSCLRCSRA